MPVVAALLALAVFKEPIVPWQMAGMLVVVVAVVKIAMRTDQMKIGLTGHPS
jgi:drug/metabolite transporter (DMT)-like permease